MFQLEEIFEKELNLAKNQIFVRKGNVDTYVYQIIEGSVKIYVENELENQIVRFGYTGDFLVALDSFLTEEPTVFYFETLKKSKIKRVNKSLFMDFIHSSEDNRNAWTKILENLVLQQLEREIDLLTISPKLRLERVLKRSPKLFQEIPNKHIANYLRMTPETLSRLKKY